MVVVGVTLTAVVGGEVESTTMSRWLCRVGRHDDLTRQPNMTKKIRHPLADMNKEMIF